MCLTIAVFPPLLVLYTPLYMFSLLDWLCLDKKCGADLGIVLIVLKKFSRIISELHNGFGVTLHKEFHLLKSYICPSSYSLFVVANKLPSN